MGLARANTVIDDDWCQYPDNEDTYFTTCVKPEHIAEWRECARVDALELSGRLLEVERQLDLLRLQAKARAEHLPAIVGRLPSRFLRHHLSEAHDQVRLALKVVTPQ